MNTRLTVAGFNQHLVETTRFGDKWKTFLPGRLDVHAIGDRLDVTIEWPDDWPKPTPGMVLNVDMAPVGEQ